MTRSSLIRAVALLTILGVPSRSGSPPSRRRHLPREPTAPSAPITALVDQLTALFPKLQGEVMEVQGET